MSKFRLTMELIILGTTVFMGCCIIMLLTKLEPPPPPPSSPVVGHLRQPRRSAHIPEISQSKHHDISGLFPPIVSPVTPIPDAKECSHSPSSSFQEFLTRKVLQENCGNPMRLDELSCMLRCPLEEPELEQSLRMARVAKYRYGPLWELCSKQQVPFLMLYRDNAWSYFVCGDRMHARSVFATVAKLLYMLTCMVHLPDVMFALDTSDFATPTHGPTTETNWIQPMPGVVRLVGTSAHPSLLLPTPAFVSGVMHASISSMRKVDWVKVENKFSDVALRNWASRKPIVFWRGSGTGLPMRHNGVVDFLPRPAATRRFEHERGFDLGFVGGLNPSAKHLEFAKDFTRLSKNLAHTSEYYSYRYLLHMDGHTASWGLGIKLVSGSLVLLHESHFSYREFYYRLLKPYEHYLPVSQDFSNMVLTRDWLETPQGDAKAEVLAKNAKALFQTRLKPSDVYCYMSRLLISLAEQQADLPGVDTEIPWAEFKSAEAFITSYGG